MNKQLLLPISFFLLFVYLNKTNVYGFLLLLSSLIVYFKDQKIALGILLVWVAVMLNYLEDNRKNLQENFQENSIVTTKESQNQEFDSNFLNVFVRIKGNISNYTLNINKNNTFADVIRLMENKTQMNLGLYKIGLQLKSDLVDTKYYYLNNIENNQSIALWNKNAEIENKQAIERLKELVSSEEEYTDEQRKLEFRKMYQLPFIINNSEILLIKKTNEDRLIYIFKNLTLLFDDEIIKNILIYENIETPDQLTKLNSQNYTDGSSQQKFLARLTSNDLENLKAFGYIFPIPGFDENRIIQLIKTKPELKGKGPESLLNELEKNIRGVLLPIEKDGLDFYLGKKQLNIKYYELLNYLGINKLFAIESIVEMINNKENYDVETLKEINYISILFYFFNLLTEDELNDKTNGWVLKSLTRIAQNYDKLFNSTDEIINKYELKKRVTETLYKQKISLDKSLTIDFDLINLSNQTNQTKEFENRTYEGEVEKERKLEFEKLNRINNAVNIYEQQKNKNPELIELNKIEKEFSNVGLDIVNEIANLFSSDGDERFTNYIDSENGDIEINTNKYMLHKYVFIFKELVIILTRDGRMFHVGLIFMVIALLMYFIEASK